MPNLRKIQLMKHRPDHMLVAHAKLPASSSKFAGGRIRRGGLRAFVGVFLALLSSSLLVPKASAQSLSASFTGVGSMSSARYRQTATLLGNGKVLIAGGFVGFGNGVLTNSAELFDPASGTFTPTSSMIWPRDSATATLLPSGKVLIAGGYTLGPPGHEYNYKALNTAELYDPASGTFTALPNMTLDRVYHTATLLPNGKVLIAGGFSDTAFISNSAELFDPASETFTRVPGTMIVWRGYHTATLLQNGKVLIAGGYQGNGLESRAELFDPASGTFTPTVPMDVILYNHTATLLPNGKVLIAGGFEQLTLSNATNTAQLFDPALGIFTPLPPMTLPRMEHTATLLPSGKVLLAGGFNAWLVAPYIITNTAELFDPASGTFTSLLPATMTSAREDQTATLVTNGKVLLAGGNSDDGINCFVGTSCVSGILNTAELFDSPSDSSTFPDARRPVISTAPDTLIQPASLILTGTGFRGDSEAGGGSFANSATNFPLVQLTRIANEQSFFVLSDPATNWSDTSFTSDTLSNLPLGQYRVTVFTNAIPSLPKIINIRLPVQLVSVVSRKVHGSAGTFDIDLPLTGAPGVECRSPGATGAPGVDYKIVFSFVNSLSNCGSASIGSLSSGPSLNQCTVNLTGVANAQYTTVTLNNVLDVQNNTGNVAATIGVLVGDVNANGVVSNTDVSVVKGQVAATVNSTNFRNDVNANGVISNTDVSLTKAQVGSTLPTPP
jgi:hypothetical protein